MTGPPDGSSLIDGINSLLTMCDTWH